VTDKQKGLLAIMLLVTQDALRRTLIELTHLKGENGLRWLSEFEAQLVRDAKDTVTEGVAMEDEVAQIDGAIQYLQFLFDGARREIAEKSKDE
jgi:hypothetical protein